MRILKASVCALAAMLVILALAGCASVRERQAASSSVVDFLFPEGAPAPSDTVPALSLPVRVGLAFVPPSHESRCGACTYTPSAALQWQLLEQVRARFKDRPFVADIVMIPEPYLRQARGFTTVEQLARLHGFDVIALISYDQVGLTSERKSSLLYLTVAGAYLVKGNHQDVHTFVDTAVFDVTTRKLLFRAPGLDVRSHNTTLVDAGRQHQLSAEQSLRAATAAMIAALDHELDAFRARVRTDGSVIVKTRQGAVGGAGGVSAAAVAILLLAGLARAVAARRVRRS